MPVFFFHLHTPRGREDDAVGTDFPSLEAAYLDVCRAIPEMVLELRQAGCDPMRCAFEIVDDEGRHLMDVPFAEMLTAGADLCRRPASDRTETMAALVERLRRLVEDNRAQVRQMRVQLRQARAAVAQVRGQRAGSPFLDKVAEIYGLRNSGEGET